MDILKICRVNSLAADYTIGLLEMCPATIKVAILTNDRKIQTWFT